MKLNVTLFSATCAALAVQSFGQTTPPPASMAASAGIVAYPAKGQDAATQSKDDGECYAWGKQQSGFDPMSPPPTAVAAQAPPPPPPPANGSRARGAARGAAAGAVVGEIANDDASEGAAVGAAAGAVAATGEERHDDALPHPKVRHARAELGHATARLMAEQHGDGTRSVAVDDRQVGVADPGGFHLDQHLSGVGALELQLPDGQWSRLRPGPGTTDLLEHRSGDDHGRTLSAVSRSSRTAAGIGTGERDVRSM